MEIQGIPVLGWTGGILASIGVLIYAFKVIRFVVRLLMKANEALDDWRGEPARPGYAARPGIAERIEAVEKQLKTNGGYSLKDQVNRIEASLNAHITETSSREHHA